MYIYIYIYVYIVLAVLVVVRSAKDTKARIGGLPFSGFPTYEAYTVVFLVLSVFKCLRGL